jgi:hypothetical protein
MGFKIRIPPGRALTVRELSRVGAECCPWLTPRPKKHEHARNPMGPTQRSSRSRLGFEHSGHRWRRCSHTLSHRVTSHWRCIEWPEHLRRLCHVSKSRIKPQVVARRREDDRHPVVNICHEPIGRGRQNCARLPMCSIWPSPASPKTSERERLPSVLCLQRIVRQ